MLVELNGSATAATGASPEEVRRKLPGCVRAERKGGAWLLTVLAAEAAARDRVQEGLGGVVRESRSVSLEDLFIALVGEEGR